jgi:hypothetical protein
MLKSVSHDIGSRGFWNVPVNEGAEEQKKQDGNQMPINSPQKLLLKSTIEVLEVICGACAGDLFARRVVAVRRFLHHRSSIDKVFD